LNLVALYGEYIASGTSDDNIAIRDFINSI
jgi:hypothetical protein